MPKAAVPARTERLTGVHLHWRLDRSSRSFKVRVVEPRDYAPEGHGKIFVAVITALLHPELGPIDPFANSTVHFSPERSDLVTFPEAFAPAETLVEVVRSLDGLGSFGCFHVGLRPSTDVRRHLFTVDELTLLVAQLGSIAESIRADLLHFQEWVRRQRPGDMFNIGCLFAVDADGLMRLCLHPKVVPSRFEIDPLPGQNMKEGDLLTLVTLLPVDPQLLTVTVQPLICSDVLNLATDIPGGTPMEAITRHAHCFDEQPPDHVDVVSVATCTPQSQASSRDGRTFREWHEQFRQAFRDAAMNPNFVRHHSCAIVLSNFLSLRGGALGGLSGVFLPVPPKYAFFHADVVVSAWGRPKKERQGGNGWSRPDDAALDTWDNRGFIVGLDPFAASAGASVRVFAFSIHRLPREHSFWTTTESLNHCEVLVGRMDETGSLVLGVEGDGHAR